jgi:hypothetical protein
VPLEKVLLGSHVGGRYADIRKYVDPELGPLVELVSCWGVFEWMLWDAFDMGYIVGVMCNSDGHKGRPGAEGPGAGQFGIANGLTCVLAESQTREAIFRALKSRRCYGTTGARIDLDFHIDDHPWIDRPECPPRACLFAKSAESRPSKDQLFEGKRVIHRASQGIWPSDNVPQPPRQLGGSRIRGRGRRVNWDGTISVVGVENPQCHACFGTPSIASTSRRTVGIIHQPDHRRHHSIDLILDKSDRGTITFESRPAGAKWTWRVDTPRRKTFDRTGHDVTIERYPRTRPRRG